MRVAVVGGGLAGLACAVELVDAGQQVIILEKRAVLGGKVSSWQDAEGDTLESGLHIFFGCYKKLLPFLQKVGAYSNIYWKEHTILLAQSGGKTTRLHFPNIPAPFSGIVAFTNNDLFTWQEKLTNILGLFGLYVSSLKFIKTLDRYSYTGWHHSKGMHQSVIDKLWNAISLSTGFIPADEMSARPMATVFHYFARSTKASRLGFLDSSPGEGIFKPIENYLSRREAQIRLNTKVHEILLDGEEKVTGLLLSDGTILKADAYVLAAPLHNARQLIPSQLKRYPYFNNLWKLKSVPVMNVQIWYDRHICTTDNLFFSSDACFSVFADLSVTSPRTYGSKAGSVIGMVVAPAALLWQLSDEEIVQKCHQDLVKLWPGAGEAVITKGTVVRIPNSIYREEPGSDTYRPAQQTPVNNLFLAGCYTSQNYMASMEGAVRSGVLAAQKIISTLPELNGLKKNLMLL